MTKNKTPQTKIKIVSLTISDWQEYKNLRLKALEDDPMAFTTSFEEAVNKVNDYWIGHLKEQDKESITLFAKKGNRLIGMIAAVFNSKKKTRHIAELVGAYVDPEFRGHGAGSKLMKGIIDQVKNHKEIIKINLGVITTQKPAIALYKKYGFKEAGTREKELYISGKYYDMLLMELRLA